VDIKTVIEQCEDNLFQRLQVSVRERSLYYHLLRHTRLVGREQHVFALVPLARALRVSETTVREDIRQLHRRGCIQIEERSKTGHLVRVLVPVEIPGGLPLAEEPPTPVDIESLDFYTDRRFVRALIERESSSCFYCLRDIRADTSALDHVVPQVTQPNNSYRNVVIACHDCNSNKQERDGRDFLRLLYRTGVLSQQELTQRLYAVEQLEIGALVPDVIRWPST
jgi:5-methylcytosine-specific restriction endonuclease McrA